jgi:hypothetical protein
LVDVSCGNINVHRAVDTHFLELRFRSKFRGRRNKNNRILQFDSVRKKQTGKRRGELVSETQERKKKEVNGANGAAKVGTSCGGWW